VKLLAQEDGTWHAWYEGKDGNYRLSSLQTADRELAEKIAAVLLAELSSPQSSAASPPIDTVFREWLREKQVEIASQTVAFYRQATLGFLTFLGPRRSVEISSICHNDIIDYRNAIAQKVEPKTVNHRIKTLRMPFEYAVRQGYIRQSPVRFVKSLKIDSSQVRRPFTMDEIRSLLSVADQEWQSLILCGLYTGQRLGDLARLTWQNVDLERGIVSLVTGKTKRHLQIPIAPPLLEHLKAWRESRVPFDRPVHPRSYRIVERCSGRVTNLSHQFIHLLAKIGLRETKPHHIVIADGRGGRRQRSEVSFHCFRHTAVTLIEGSQCTSVRGYGVDRPLEPRGFAEIHPRW
jgi:integrase